MEGICCVASGSPVCAASLTSSGVFVLDCKRHIASSQSSICGKCGVSTRKRILRMFRASVEYQRRIDH